MELQHLVAGAYEMAKTGEWDLVLSEWKEIPLLARRCSRYQKDNSGWTFLHQAAYFGNEVACRELIRLGASLGRKSLSGKTAIDIAEERGFTSVVSLLCHAFIDEDSLWVPSIDPDLHPGSDLWDEASECNTQEVLFVLYAGGVVKIPKGARYFVDSFDRILIGWHGTYDPPSGMDGESMIRFVGRR